MSRYSLAAATSVALLLGVCAAVVIVSTAAGASAADPAMPPLTVSALGPSAAMPEEPWVRVSPDAAQAFRTALSSSPARVPATEAGPEQVEAERLLRRLIERHPILRGARVTFGPTPGGAQAVTYYTIGEIVVNPSHRASLERIMEHEAWHLIDWRDNGRIDWGEDVPR